MKCGFTRCDLLALCGLLSFLLLLQVVAQSRNAVKPDAAICLENLRALTRGWHLYAEDNQEEFPGAATWSLNGKEVPNWGGGSWLELTNPRDRNNWDHETYTKKSPLWSYLDSVEVFRCPADPSTGINNQRQVVPRIRSYSVNCWVGGPGWNDSGPWWPQTGRNETGWRVARKLSDAIDPGPSKTFSFIDEREDSINDSYFAVNMAGYTNNPGSTRIVDYPGDSHSRGANLSFLDGHVEYWKWTDKRTTPAHERSGIIMHNVPSLNNPDVRRLQDASTRSH